VHHRFDPGGVQLGVESCWCFYGLGLYLGPGGALISANR
jgi:hypothetical protein